MNHSFLVTIFKGAKIDVQYRVESSCIQNVRIAAYVDYPGTRAGDMWIQTIPHSEIF